MECAVGAASSQSEKVLLPKPSGQAPIRMMVRKSASATARVMSSGVPCAVSPRWMQSAASESTQRTVS